LEDFGFPSELTSDGYHPGITFSFSKQSELNKHRALTYFTNPEFI